MTTFDPIGEAVQDYFLNGMAKSIIVHSLQFDDDEMPVDHLFRKRSQMPVLEQKALELSCGKVLDVGACAGAHCLELQKTAKEVYALERSALCAKVMGDRGVNNIICADIFNCELKDLDTITVLMNGTGLAGSIDRLEILLHKFAQMLNPGGQVLIDSSDLKYLYEEEDGSFLIDLNDRYYGEVDFQMEYKGKKGEWFSWLYIDPDTFAMITEKCGFSFDIAYNGAHYDYLARLLKK